MTIKVAINGYGRIGRMLLRAIYEEKFDDIQVVAINGLGGIDINVHLTQYDSTHWRFPGTIEVDGDHLAVNSDRIKMFSTWNSQVTPWGKYGVDVVLESSGVFTSKEIAMVHIKQPAKKVLISALRKRCRFYYRVWRKSSNWTAVNLGPLPKRVLQSVGLRWWSIVDWADLIFSTSPEEKIFDNLSPKKRGVLNMAQGQRLKSKKFINWAGNLF